MKREMSASVRLRRYSKNHTKTHPQKILIMGKFKKRILGKLFIKKGLVWLEIGFEIV